MIVNLFSGPRNLSTALMYAWAQRSDTVVVDEPFYAYYLTNHASTEHPGREETIASQPTKPSEVFEQIHALNETSEHIFLKNMPHHMTGIDPTPLLKYEHVFLIREIKRMIHSFTKVIPDVEAKDFALEDQLEMFEYLEANGKTPLVITAETILENPEKALKAICSQLGINFESNMLSWPAGPKTYDGSWASYWYGNVHKSDGFKPTSVPDIELPTQYDALYQSLLPAHTILSEKSISI